jgi:hypothetical protein
MRILVLPLALLILSNSALAATLICDITKEDNGGAVLSQNTSQPVPLTSTQGSTQSQSAILDGYKCYGSVVIRSAGGQPSALLAAIQFPSGVTAASFESDNVLVSDSVGNVNYKCTCSTKP